MRTAQSTLSTRERSLAAGEELIGFIRDTFRSVWAIELLLLLKKTPQRTWSTAELVTELRASEHIVTSFGDSLVAAGLVVADEAGAYRYGPAGKPLARLADATEALYAKRPDGVRRMIVANLGGDLDAFADA